MKKIIYICENEKEPFGVTLQDVLQQIEADPRAKIFDVQISVNAVNQSYDCAYIIYDTQELKPWPKPNEGEPFKKGG